MRDARNVMREGLPFGTGLRRREALKMVDGELVCITDMRCN
jgi:hypothetical protein